MTRRLFWASRRASHRFWPAWMLAGWACSLGAGASHRPEGAPAPATTSARHAPSRDSLFTKVAIADVRSEACAVADLNRDGRLDIVAGNYWYEAPGWTRHQFRTLPGAIDSAGNGFLNSDFDVPMDVDGDGWTDIVSGYLSDGLAWYRNPGTGPGTGEWPRMQVDGGDHHSGELWDIDGDGKRLEILSGKDTTRWYEIGTLPTGKRGLIRHDVWPDDQQWGYGVGDLNGDGRPDVIRPDAWFEAPSDPRRGRWQKHCLALGFLEDGGEAFPQESGCGMTEHTQQIWVYDVDGDGRNDIVTGGAHTYGLFWYRQVRGADGGLTFVRDIIDRSWSQVHAIAMADIDGDGDLDVVAGKRWRAHGTGDPGGLEPPGVYWYELERGRAPTWVKHVLSYDEGVSAGMNVAIADIDRDRDLDVVVTSKAGGPFLFLNRLRDRRR